MQTLPDTIHVILEKAKEPECACGGYYWIAGALLALVILFNWRYLKKLWGRIKPAKYKVALLGFDIEGDIRYQSEDQELAWKIYIELITRVASQKLEEDSGILRESLSSLHAAFGNLRTLLKEAGAGFAKPPKPNEFSIAGLLLIIMNDKIRPFLSKWHPRLEAHEKTIAVGQSQSGHENTWAMKVDFRSDLEALRLGLVEYIEALKNIAGGK